MRTQSRQHWMTPVACAISIFSALLLAWAGAPAERPAVEVTRSDGTQVQGIVDANRFVTDSGGGFYASGVYGIDGTIVPWEGVRRVEVRLSNGVVSATITLPDNSKRELVIGRGIRDDSDRPFLPLAQSYGTRVLVPWSQLNSIVVVNVKRDRLGNPIQPGWKYSPWTGEKLPQ